MSNKKTAVEWLIEQLRMLAHNPKTHLGMGDIRVTQGYIDEIEEQAKQIYKEQIKEAFWNGDNSDCTNEQNSFEFAEQYYNETYNKKDNDN